MLRIPVAVKVVVLNLEVFPKGNENIPSLGEILGGGNPGLMHSKSNGKIERVEGGFVTNNKVVLVVIEAREIDTVLGCGKKV